MRLNRNSSCPTLGSIQSPTFAGCHFNAYNSNPPCTSARKLRRYYAASLRSVKCAASGYHTQIYSFHPSSFLNHIIVSFHIPRSIPLSRLRPRINIPRGDVITRVLLQSIGLCLRALRIELLAKLAFALRRLGSFLVVREHDQLSVLMLQVYSTEPAICR